MRRAALSLVGVAHYLSNKQMIEILSEFEMTIKGNRYETAKGGDIHHRSVGP